MLIDNTITGTKNVRYVWTQNFNIVSISLPVGQIRSEYIKLIRVRGNIIGPVIIDIYKFTAAASLMGH